MDSEAAGAHNSTFEGDVTSPPTTAGGAGDNTLSPVLSPTSDTEHTTAGTLLNPTNIFLSFINFLLLTFSTHNVFFSITVGEIKSDYAFFFGKISNESFILCDFLKNNGF